MQKCFDCDYDRAIVKCTNCKGNLCVQCNTKKHMLSSKTPNQLVSTASAITKPCEKYKWQNHKYYLVCEECDQRERECYCPECDEKFCNLCFTAFHKRGNRITHTKNPLGNRENFVMFLNVMFFDCSQNYDDKFKKLLTEYLKNHKYLMKYIMIITNDEEELRNRIDDAVFLEIVEIKEENFFKDISVFKQECQKLIAKEYNLNKAHLFFYDDGDFSSWLSEMYKNIKIKKVSSFVSDETESGVKINSQHDEISELKTRWNVRVSLKSEKLASYEQSYDKRMNKCFSADNQEASPIKIGNFSKLSYLLESSNITEFLRNQIKHPLYHIFNDIEYEDQNFKHYSLLIQQELHEKAINGNTKILYDKFVLYIQNKYEIALPKIQALISKAVEANIIYKQVRQLSNSHSLIFLSLKSSFLFSHENLLWIVKSLKKDKVSFSIPMILNRIKDVFDLSVNEDFVYDLFDDYIQYKYSSEADDDILFRSLDIIRVSEKNYTILYYDEKEITNSVLNSKLYKDDFEDLIEVDENSYEFGLFKNFIDHVFTLDLIHINEKYQQITNETLSEIIKSDAMSKGSRSSQMYKLSSIDPYSLNADNLAPAKTIKFEYSHKIQQSYKSSNFATYSRDLDKQSETLMKNNSIKDKTDKPVHLLNRFKKVIPGGKYGLALFIKYFGFQQLRLFSIGKILALIDKTIKFNIIRYSKTFIFKNDDFNFSDEDPDQLIDKEKLFDRFKVRLMTVLHENNGQIMIAQAKELIEKSEEIMINEFERFGFNKLKNIIEEFEEDFRIIEVKKGTFIITNKSSEFKLVNKRIEQIANGVETRSQKKNKKKKQKKLAGNSPAHVNDSCNNSLKDTVENNVTQKIELLTVPSDILYKVKVNIFRILNSAQTGLEPQEIYELLQQKFNMEFDAVLFGYKSFYSFLIAELKDLVEIEIKYLENEENKHLIYLKNKKFGVMNKEKYMITNKLSLSKNDNCIMLSQTEIETLDDKIINNLIGERVNDSSISELPDSKGSFCFENVSQQISYKSLIEKLKSENITKIKKVRDTNMKKLSHLHSLGEKVENAYAEGRIENDSIRNLDIIDSGTNMTQNDLYGYDSKSVN